MYAYTNILAALLQRAYVGNAWHGPALRELLAATGGRLPDNLEILEGDITDLGVEAIVNAAIQEAVTGISIAKNFRQEAALYLHRQAERVGPSSRRGDVVPLALCLFLQRRGEPLARLLHEAVDLLDGGVPGGAER